MNKLRYESMRDYNYDFTIENNSLDFENQPHFHKNLEIIYVLSGNYVCNVNGERHELEPDDICYISPCKIHSAPPCKGGMCFLFMASENLLGDFSSTFKNSAFPVILNNKQFNRDRILPFLQLFKQPTTPFLEKGAVNYILGLLLTEYELVQSPPDKNSDVVIKVVQFIDNHYAEKLTLDYVAQKLGYSKFYFSRLFNSIIQKSFSDYLNLVRIDKFLTKYNDAKTQNITELLYECGFDSPTTFYRNFKKIYGVTPSEYLTK